MTRFGLRPPPPPEIATLFAFGMRLLLKKGTNSKQNTPFEVETYRKGFCAFGAINSLGVKLVPAWLVDQFETFGFCFLRSVGFRDRFGCCSWEGRIRSCHPLILR